MSSEGWLCFFPSCQVIWENGPSFLLEGLPTSPDQPASLLRCSHLVCSTLISHLSDASGMSHVQFLQATASGHLKQAHSC